MKLPRDVDGDELAVRLHRIGYSITRQTGSHLRLTTLMPGEHHITVPRHHPLRVGTLSTILTEVAAFQGLSREQLIELLFA